MKLDNNLTSVTQLYTALKDNLRKNGRILLAGLFVALSLVLITLVGIVAWTYFNSYLPQENHQKTHYAESNEKYTKTKFHWRKTHDKGNDDSPSFVPSTSSELNFDELVSTNVVNSDLMHDGRFDSDNQDMAEWVSPSEYRDKSFVEMDSDNNNNRQQLQEDPQYQRNILLYGAGSTVKTSKKDPELVGAQQDNKDISDGAQAMKLYKVEKAIKAGAVCLDGSPPAYYHRPGIGPNERSWIIHFNGGAWCFDKNACVERSRSSLGSTKKLPKSPPIIQGINSPNPATNPDFYDWNLVWIVYCDGASFTGNLERPVISKEGDTIYMRGKRVLNAIVNDLLFNLDLQNAESVILTGSSAGSMAAIFQADYIASKFPKTVPIKVLADAGYFINTKEIGGKNLEQMFQKVYNMQNSTAGLNQACISEMRTEPWKCFLPAIASRYVKVPVYYLNSAYDIWSLIYFLGIDCKFPTLDDGKRRRKRQLVDFNQTSEPFGVERVRNIKDGFRQYYPLQKNLEKLERQSRDVSGFEMRPFFRDFTSALSEKRTLEISKTTTSLKKSTIQNHAKHLIRNSTLAVVENDETRKNPANKLINDRNHFANPLPTKNTSINKETSSNSMKTDKSLSNITITSLYSHNLPKSLKQNEKILNTSAVKSSIIIFTTNNSNINRTNSPQDSKKLFKKDKVEKPNHETMFTNKLKFLESLLSPKKTLRVSHPNSEHENILRQSMHSKLELQNMKKNADILEDISHDKGDNLQLTKKKNLAQKQKEEGTPKVVESKTRSMTNKKITKTTELNEKTPTNRAGILHSESGKVDQSTNSTNINQSKIDHSKPDKIDQSVKSTHINQSDINKFGASEEAEKPTKSQNPRTKYPLKRRRSASIAREYINILRSDPPECTEDEIHNALKYRDVILGETDLSMAAQKGSGRFLVSCMDHSMSLFDETWNGIKIRGKSIQQAFGDWFFDRVSKDKSNLVDCPYPCNDSCP